MRNAFTKIVRYGKFVEVWNYQYPVLTKQSGKLNNESTDNTTDKEKNRSDRLHRVRHNIRRLVCANFDSNHWFITLTFRDNISNLVEANKLFKKFIRRLRENKWSGGIKPFSAEKAKTLKKMKYLAVVQIQDGKRNGKPRGVIHYHVIFNKKPFIGTLTKKTIVKKGVQREIFISDDLEKRWAYGFVFQNKIKTVSNVGAYVSAYLTTSKYDPRFDGQKLFFRSHNLKSPVVFYSPEPDYSQKANQKLIFDRQFKTKYLGEIRYRNFLLTS